jgi:COP9 signalosome complex subunit 8
MVHRPPARYALTRLPHALANHALPQALFSLLAATWDRKHTSVYQRSQELADVVSAPVFFSQPLATLVRNLNERFIGNSSRTFMGHCFSRHSVDEFRERTFALISRAYTTISLPLIQTYLGPLPVDKILSGTLSLVMTTTSFHFVFKSRAAEGLVLRCRRAAP